MKIALIILSIFFCFQTFSQNKFSNIEFLGEWKTTSFLSKGKYYMNFENDSVAVYDRRYRDMKHGQDSLEFIYLLKENAKESLDIYLFENDSICKITHADKSVYKYKTLFDNSSSLISFSLLGTKANELNSFKMKYVLLNSNQIQLEPVDNSLFIWILTKQK